MTNDLTGGPILCVFCVPVRSPVDGRVLRACRHCQGGTGWCECLFCPLVEEDE